jgi:hypothetical protein
MSPRRADGIAPTLCSIAEVTPVRIEFNTLSVTIRDTLWHLVHQIIGTEISL